MRSCNLGRSATEGDQPDYSPARSSSSLEPFPAGVNVRDAMKDCPDSVSFSRMPGFPRLFASYAEDYPALARHFGGNWQSGDAVRGVAARIDMRHRSAVAAVLEEQNAAWGGADASVLREPETLAVVTGQQLGLFGGPLYTVYKALTAIKLARHLTTELGRRVVPVFWLEGADHDLDEITGLVLPQAKDIAHVRYRGHALPPHGNLGSVGRLALTRDIVRLREEIRGRLQPTEFSDEVLGRYCGGYREGASFMYAFARLLAALFSGSGLILANPEVPKLKRLVAPLFRRELADHATTAKLVEKTSEVLKADYHAQIRTRPTNLFVGGSLGREAISPNGRDFILRPSGDRVTGDDLGRKLAASPELFSPNVALRPLVQDSLLPTVAYVAGPGEVSYFAQLKPLYAWAGLPMPVIYPRASVTVLESGVQRVLDKYGLDVAGAGEDLERLFQRLVLASTDVEGAFAPAARGIEAVMHELRPGVESVDPTLGRSVEAARAGMLKELSRLRSRAIRAEKRKHQEMRAQLARAQRGLYPGGRLQERTLPTLYFLNKYGPAFLDRLREQVTLGTHRHQIVCL